MSTAEERRDWLAGVIVNLIKCILSVLSGAEAIPASVEVKRRRGARGPGPDCQKEDYQSVSITSLV